MQHRVEVQHEPQRRVEEHGRQHKGRQRARRGAPGGGFGDTDGKDQQNADTTRRHPHVVLVARQRSNPVRAFGQQPLVQFAQAPAGMFLGLRGADEPAARDGLLRERSNVSRKLSLRLQRGLFARRDEAPDHQQDRRQRQHRGRHPPVKQEGRNQGTGKLDSPEETLHDQVLRPVTRLLRISNESVGQLPAGLPVKKSPIAANHPGKDVGPQVLVRAHQSALPANPVRDDGETMEAVGAADGQHQDHDKSDFPGRQRVVQQGADQERNCRLHGHAGRGDCPQQRVHPPALDHVAGKELSSLRNPARHHAATTTTIGGLTATSSSPTRRAG